MSKYCKLGEHYVPVGKMATSRHSCIACMREQSAWYQMNKSHQGFIAKPIRIKNLRLDFKTYFKTKVYVCN